MSTYETFKIGKYANFYYTALRPTVLGGATRMAREGGSVASPATLEQHEIYYTFAFGYDSVIEVCSNFRCMRGRVDGGIDHATTLQKANRSV